MERFWSKVALAGPDECWLWLASRDAHGYGRIKVNDHVVKAHRFAFELANGALPGGLEVRHICATPPCVNPCHLLAGTHSENMMDRAPVARIRHARLAAMHSRKLTECQAEQLRDERRAGATYLELMRKFGLSKTAVSYVVNQKTYKPFWV